MYRLVHVREVLVLLPARLVGLIEVFYRVAQAIVERRENLAILV